MKARFHKMVGPQRELDRSLFDKKEKEKNGVKTGREPKTFCQG
jgi:hypothetical protein